MYKNKNIDNYKKILIDMRSKIIRQFEEEKLKNSDVPKIVIGDEVDLASEERNQKFLQLMSERDKLKLDKIQTSLESIENGRFGICEECGEDISTKRLDAIPYTTMCIDCQEKEEAYTGFKNDKLSYSGVNFGSED